MSSDPTEKTDWTNIEHVFALLETNERKLTLNEKRIIAGQRLINGILYQALDAILQSFPDESASPAILKAKDLLKDLPGKEPIGCNASNKPETV